jgi:hypothetical protein
MLCVEVTLAQLAFSQTGDSADAAASTSPVAFVYVASSPSSNTSEINAFAAAPNGALSPVSGSPFSADVQYLAVNGKYLFGSNGIYIYSFSIASRGALRKVASINAQQFNPYHCGAAYDLFLDHTGATLYDVDYDADCANTAYQSFGIDSFTGKLSYLGVTSAATPAFSVPLSFIGNNEYAYSSSCYHFNPQIFGFKRNSDETLTYLNTNPPMPAAASGDFYCPGFAAADPTNHVAISVLPLSGSTWQPVGATQLAVYTADGSGNLTTNSTVSNMPTTAVTNVMDYWMSPSGKLLAVAGTGGLQVFHFNGGNPITHYTGLLTKNQIDQLFWDNANHLYALSRSAGKLFVFTITPTSASQAPGSPYTITNPQNIIVLPKT